MITLLLATALLACDPPADADADSADTDSTQATATTGTGTSTAPSACVSELADWAGVAPATPEEALACDAGPYSYYDGDLTSCDAGAVVECPGIPYSIVFYHDADNALVGVKYCSDIEEFCGETSWCELFGVEVDCP